MQSTDQPGRLSSRQRLRPVQIAFLPLLAAFVGLTAWAVTDHNPLSRNLMLLSVFFLAVMSGCRRASAHLPARADGIVAGAAALCLFGYCAIADIPITNVAIEVVDAQVAAEVVVVPVHREDTVDPIPDWLTPWRTNNHLRYMLKEPIVGDQRSLKFRFAKTNRPYLIRQISYGTDFFRLPFKLSTFTDDRIRRIARVNPTNNQLDRIDDGNGVKFALTNKIRSNPAVMIPAAEEMVRQNVKSATEIMARLIWFSIHLAVILAAWKWQSITRLIRPDPT